jgi:hypothetical protein
MEAGAQDEVVGRWAECFGPARQAYLDATAALVKATTEYPALGHCYHYTYTYSSKDKPWPRPYPGEALEALAALKDAKLPAALREAAALARKAATGYTEVLATPELPDTPKSAAKSLRAEAARVEGLATVFAFLLEVRKGKPKPGAAATCAEVRAQLLEAMKVVELGKPAWVGPACLHSLSVLLQFLDQLQGDLQAGGKIRWSLA